MNLKTILPVLAITIFTASGFSQSVNKLPDSLIVKNVFFYKNGNFEGKGWDLLKKELTKSHLVCIGEQHGVAEVPVFTGKIAEIIQPKALVVEIDPYTATKLSEIAKKPAEYSDYFKRKPYDFAFYSWQSEMNLIHKITLSNVEIWGINEINFLSIPTFFETLASTAKEDSNKKIVLKKAAAYTKNDFPLYGDTNKYNDFIAYRIKNSEVDSLLYDFRNENAISQKMLRDLKLSLPIFSNTSYQSRVSLMKKNLLNYLYPYITADEIKIPKLLFKLGANHASRWEFEISELADNLVDAAGKKSLHILAIGKQGTINAMAPVDNNKAIIAYNGLEEFKEFIPFFEKVSKDEWIVFDVRPIRRLLSNNKIVISDPKLKSYIMGFDLFVFFDKATGDKFIQ
ncbi:hypothetical protein [Flavobacterium chilense]|uniref:Erythromycin esterase homolog n=1 Tax=Flavobacterium chilense TaxID=946677 RepID=A0A1M7ADE9_9FLAO|nr:hypothetical protein [Flavobacterium chilense]SHL40801.1 hypothetical protein SAMN05444484_1011392 [Flavobacterium chilense]